MHNRLSSPLTMSPVQTALILTETTDLKAVMAWCTAFLKKPPELVIAAEKFKSQADKDTAGKILFAKPEQIPALLIQTLQNGQDPASSAGQIQILLNPPLDQAPEKLLEAIGESRHPENELRLYDIRRQSRQNILIRSLFNLFRFPVPFFWVVPIKMIASLQMKGDEGKLFAFLLFRQLKRGENAVRFFSINPMKGSIQRTVNLTRAHLILCAISTFLRYSLSSLTSLVVDNLVFYIAYLLTGLIGISLILGRVFSLTINYLLLRNSVFSGESGLNEKPISSGHPPLIDRKTFLSYLALVIFSGTIVWLMTGFITARIKTNPVPVKLSVELIMFFVNYSLSKKWVFRQQK